MSFRDLEQNAGLPAVPPAAVPAPAATSRALVERLQRMDLSLVAIGCFILGIGLTGEYSGDSVRVFARHVVENTIICEFYMFWIFIGAFFAKQSPAWLRIPLMLASVVICLLAITYDREFSIVPQACLVLATRILPARGEVPLSSSYVQRVLDFSGTSLACLLVQLLVFVSLSSLLASVGIGTNRDHVITAPHWFAALIWGAYYLELAFLLPWIASFRAKDPGGLI